MPNIKSAIKRVDVIEKKTLQNNMVKSAYKTAVKAFDNAVEAGDKAKAEETFKAAVKKVDQACSKGVLKANTASRKKSSLAKKLNNVK
jgi:small subunit ribosomal protein S20